MTTTTGTPRRWLPMLIAMALATTSATALVALGPTPLTAPAGAQGCEGDTTTEGGGTTVGVDCEEDGSTSGGDEGSTSGGPGGNGNGGGSLDAGALCAAHYPGWDDCVTVVNANGVDPRNICGYVVAPDQSLLHYYQPDAPDDAVLMYFVCPREGNYYTEDTQWAPAGTGAVVIPPSPEEVAAGIWVGVQATLLEPALTTSPDVGDPAIYSVPTFVHVDNWQGEIVEEGCDTGVCVTLTATPTLTFDPGDGSDVIACDPPGTLYDPGGASADAQASVPGACAHPYRAHTGGDRPAAWEGSVSIAWTVGWTSDGDAGELEGVTLSTALTRSVDEVTALVTRINGG